MSNSPFELFRRYLRPLMVFLTLLALFAFVVLPALQGYLQRAGGVVDPTLATYDGTPMKASRVETFTRNHYEIVNFLREIAMETIRRKGMPRTAGFQFNAQTNQIQDLGIFSQPSQLATIRTLQFASEAKKAGFELDDAAIRTWLNRFTDGTMSDNEVIQRLMISSKNRLGQFHLYVSLRQLLLAQVYQRIADSGLSAGAIPGMGEIPVTTPAQQWENFLKLQQQATVDTYGVLVSDFIDQTDANPSQSEIEEVYEEGKNRLPNDQSPDPAFRRPTIAQFEYVAANLNTFIDREVSQFTDEQLREEYQKRIDGGDFALPADSDESDSDEPKDSLDGLGLSDGEDTSSAEDASPETEKATEDSPSESTSDSGSQPEMKEEASADANAEDSAGDSAKDAEATTSEETGSETPTEAPSSDEQSRRSADTVRATMLVALQEQDADEATDEGDSETEESESSDDAETVAADSTDETTAEEPEKESVETPSADVPMKTGEDAEEAPPTKFEEFEDVRNDIADDLARPIAAKKLDAAVREMMKRMRYHFGELSIHESNVEIGIATEKDAPPMPDLKAMAEELGLEYGSIGERDVQEIADEPIGNSVGTGTSLNRRGPDFALLMYGFNNGQQSIAPQPLYSPLTTVDLTAGKTYVSWKTDEVESYAPTLEEARDEVVMAIRTREARRLAEREAERIATEWGASPNQSLTEIVPADRADQIKTGLGPFSWMNMMGFGQMTIGNVPQLDSVGPRFMRATFTTEIGKVGVAPNAPQRTYYVIKPRSFQPETSELRERFLQRSERFMAQLITNTENQQLRNGFYQSLDERTGFQFAMVDEEE